MRTIRLHFHCRIATSLRPSHKLVRPRKAGGTSSTGGHRWWRAFNARYHPTASRLEEGRVMLVAVERRWSAGEAPGRYYDTQLPSSGPKCNTGETEPLAGLSSGSSSGWQHCSSPLAFCRAHRREHAWRAAYSSQRRNRGFAVLWSAVRCWRWFVRWLDSCVGCPEHREASRRCASRRLR